MSARASFEARVEPLSHWGENIVELWNLINPGCKTTALVSTMRVSDPHSFFLGRLSPHGNELEIREVASRMAALLRPLFPLPLFLIKSTSLPVRVLS